MKSLCALLLSRDIRMYLYTISKESLCKSHIVLKLEVLDFKDPKKRESFITLYCIQYILFLEENGGFIPNFRILFQSAFGGLDLTYLYVFLIFILVGGKRGKKPNRRQGFFSNFLGFLTTKTFGGIASK